MADGEHEVRAVHGVEVKGVDAVLGEFLHLARRQPSPPPALRVSGSSSRPSNFSASQSGTLVPARVTKARACLKLVHRHDAGTTGISMPRALTRSR